MNSLKTNYFSKLRNQTVNMRLTTAGFTIVELLIATLVFSMVLLLIAVGVLQFNHAYFSGVTQSNTQDTARSVLENMSQAIQFSGGTITTNLGTTKSGPYSTSGFCLGTVRYSYVTGWELAAKTNKTKHQTNHALVEDSNGNCGGKAPQSFAGALAAGSVELLNSDMRLSKLSVTAVPGSNNLFKIDVRVVYGDDDLLTNPPDGANTTCVQGSGDQFCAVSELSTVVQQRIE